MMSFKTITKTAAVLSLSVLSVGLAYGRGLTSTTGSLDIYTTDFQKAFATGSSVPQAQEGKVTTGSIDIYETDFQKAFVAGSRADKAASTVVITGSVDIYATNFRNI